MIKNNYLACILSIFFVFFGCSKKLQPPKYYLENIKSEGYKLRGPVKHLDRIFFNKNEKFINRIESLPSRPLQEIIGYGGHVVFDKKGQYLEARSFRDSLHFFDPDTTTNWTSVYFHKKPDNMPDANPVYNSYVLVPGKLKMSGTYYSDKTTWTSRKRGRITTIDTTYLPNGSRSQWRYYSYELDSIGRVKYRRKRESINGDKEPHYSETVRYYYDSINRIVKEHYSFFEMVDGSDRFPNGSASYYFYRPFNALQQMSITYEYNDKNLVSKATVYHFTDEILHQTYQYDEDNDLVSSEYIVNGNPTIMEYAPIKQRKFNKQGDIIYERFLIKDGSLMREVWVDYYDYDEYNNWQRLEMFLSNTHEGERA
jgi:uncharacterized lipoprotein NlpE involved in copper resistance